MPKGKGYGQTHKLGDGRGRGAKGSLTARQQAKVQQQGGKGNQKAGR